MPRGPATIASWTRFPSSSSVAAWHSFGSLDEGRENHIVLAWEE
jgi:hypothetical protein